MSEPLYPTPPPPAGPPPTMPPPGGPPAGRGGLPWDHRKDLGALMETAKLLITSPGRAYAMAREKGDYGSPLLFAVVFFIIGAILNGLWQLVFGPQMWTRYMEDMPPEMRDMMGGFGGGAAGAGGLVLGIVLAPIFGIIALFIWSGIVHLTLRLLGGLRDSTAGFEGTFRAVAYSTVAELAVIVPLLGGFIAAIWFLVLQMLGLAALHRTSQGKSLGALLIPAVVCCCIVVGIAMAMGAAVGAALSGMGN